MSQSRQKLKDIVFLNFNFNFYQIGNTSLLDSHDDMSPDQGQTFSIL